MAIVINRKRKLYQIDSIIDKAILGNRVVYKVRWRGYSDSEDTWEPSSSLRKSCPNLIVNFNKSSGKKNVSKFLSPENNNNNESLENKSPVIKSHNWRTSAKNKMLRRKTNIHNSSILRKYKSQQFRKTSLNLKLTRSCGGLNRKLDSGYLPFLALLNTTFEAFTQIRQQKRQLSSYAISSNIAAKLSCPYLYVKKFFESLIKEKLVVCSNPESSRCQLFTISENFADTLESIDFMKILNLIKPRCGRLLVDRIPKSEDFNVCLNALKNELRSWYSQFSAGQIVDGSASRKRISPQNGTESRSSLEKKLKLVQIKNYDPSLISNNKVDYSAPTDNSSSCSPESSKELRFQTVAVPIALKSAEDIASTLYSLPHCSAKPDEANSNMSPCKYNFDSEFNFSGLPFNGFTQSRESSRSKSGAANSEKNSFPAATVRTRALAAKDPDNYYSRFRNIHVSRDADLGIFSITLIDKPMCQNSYNFSSNGSSSSSSTMDSCNFLNSGSSGSSSANFDSNCNDSEPFFPKQNSLTISVLEELTQVLSSALVDERCRVLLLTGKGSVFSHGLDYATVIRPDSPKPVVISNSQYAVNDIKTRFTSTLSPLIREMFFPFSFLNCRVLSRRNLTSSACTGLANDSSDLKPNANCTVPGSVSDSCVAGIPNSVVSTVSGDNVNTHAINTLFCQPILNLQYSSHAHHLACALCECALSFAHFPKPIVAAVNGTAVGAAVGLLPLCDLVYATEKATFYLPYLELGQVPECGLSVSMQALIGGPLSNEMLLAGRKISAKHALQRGLLSDILSTQHFRYQVMEICKNLAQKPRRGTELIKCLGKIQFRESLEIAIISECRKLAAIWSDANFKDNVIKFSKMDQNIII